MSPVEGSLRRLNDRIADLSARLGRRVELDLQGLVDRSGELDLQAPGRQSPNGSCRLVETADGWIAVNLPRQDDIELLPAWLGIEPARDPWPGVEAAARPRGWRELVAAARELGLPVAGVGEVSATRIEALMLCGRDLSPREAERERVGRGRRGRFNGRRGGSRILTEPQQRGGVEPPSPNPLPLSLRSGERGSLATCLKPTGGALGGIRVLDLSTLWAGPLCGAVLAAAGAEVAKVESRRRPDPSRESTPGLFQRLNGGKADVVLDFTDPGVDQARLREMMLAAHVVITSARPRAFEQLGLAPTEVFAERPSFIWVAVSGYGWTGKASDRVAFGDDAAAAGGLVGWTETGEPRFLGDALADPLTGLAAAEGALRALIAGGGVIVDAALARCAAGAASERV